jgi:hypothetical protein
MQHPIWLYAFLSPIRDMGQDQKMRPQSSVDVRGHISAGAFSLSAPWTDVDEIGIPGDWKLGQGVIY